MRPPSVLFSLLAGLALCQCAGSIPFHGSRGEGPSGETEPLRRSGTFSSPLIKESSGLVKSKQFPGVFWTHNDSGDVARLFPVARDGTLLSPAGLEESTGIRIPGAQNVDWEDITADDEGNLLIGDIGNNRNTRRDLAIYIVPEPDYRKATVSRGARRVPFYYPDQSGFPPSERNFDAEALFWARGKLYLLTKHRSDTYTKLYRFDSLDPSRPNALTLVAGFNIRGQVTAADASDDGSRLAVLTFNALWLFEAPDRGDDYFQGRISWLPLRAKQCEAVCFDGQSLLIGNEQGEIYEVALNRLRILTK